MSRAVGAEKINFGRWGGSPAQRMHRRRCTRRTCAVIIINIVQHRCDGGDFGRRPPPPPLPASAAAARLRRRRRRVRVARCTLDDRPYGAVTQCVCTTVYERQSSRASRPVAVSRAFSRVCAQVFASRFAVSLPSPPPPPQPPRALEDRTRSVFDMDAERFRFPKSCKCTIWYDTSAPRFRRILHTYPFRSLSRVKTTRLRRREATATGTKKINS